MYCIEAEASIHPPEAMMHFPPVSDFPSVSGKISDSEENFHNDTFTHKNFDFHPPKFLMTFFSHRLQIFNFPLFWLFQYISPYFAKIIIPLPLQMFPQIS